MCRVDVWQSDPVTPDRDGPNSPSGGCRSDNNILIKRTLTQNVWDGARAGGAVKCNMFDSGFRLYKNLDAVLEVVHYVGDFWYVGSDLVTPNEEQSCTAALWVFFSKKRGLFWNLQMETGFQLQLTCIDRSVHASLHYHAIINVINMSVRAERWLSRGFWRLCFHGYFSRMHVFNSCPEAGGWSSDCSDTPPLHYKVSSGQLGLGGEKRRSYAR